MSTFDETNVRRQPEGVSTGGQFATKPRSESDVALAAPAAGAPATARVRRVADADLVPGTRVLVPGAGPGSAYFAATVKEVDMANATIVVTATDPWTSETGDVELATSITWSSPVPAAPSTELPDPHASYDVDEAYDVEVDSLAAGDHILLDPPSPGAAYVPARVDEVKADTETTMTTVSISAIDPDTGEVQSVDLEFETQDTIRLI